MRVPSGTILVILAPFDSYAWRHSLPSPSPPLPPPLPLSVKTRSNSFHSTLEPNTEVFSKVSRSLAQFTLVNSVSTLLNKGGMSCNCPKASQDFCVNQNKQASAQLLCSSLVLSRHERSEGRRNSCEAEKAHLLRATRTSSRMPQGHLWCLALIMANTKHATHAKPCHKHAKVHANVHANVCSGKTTYQSHKKQIEGTQKETDFPRSELRRGLWPFWSRAQQGWVGVKLKNR